MKKGMVIAGDYKNYNVVMGNCRVFLMSTFDKVELSKSTVQNYSVISDIKSSKWSRELGGSMSNIIEGSVINVLFKQSSNVYVSIDFRSGQSCLLEVNKKVYKSINDILM